MGTVNLLSNEHVLLLEFYEEVEGKQSKVYEFYTDKQGAFRIAELLKKEGGRMGGIAVKEQKPVFD